jgi:heavy metal sensor kinase
MVLRSIRFKIFLWSILVLSLMYSLSSFVLFHELDRRLQADVDGLLMSKAEGIRDSIESYWEAERLEVAQGGPAGLVLSKRGNINFEKVVLRWLREKVDDRLLADIDVQILDPRGRLMASSGQPAFARWGAPQLPGGIKPNEPRLEDRSVEISPGHSRKYRVFTSPQMERGQLAYSVQVISSLSPLASSLSHLRIILFLLFPFIFVFSGLAGVVLTRVTVNPLTRMVDTIRRISAENLRLRVPVPDTRDELKRLAETFNDMLERLEKAFLSQQQFIENLAHEVKTPLAAIKGELEVTLRRLRSVEDYESVLHSSLEEVDRIIGLSENLLTLARYESDRVSLNKGPVDIGTLVKETADCLSVPALQRDIALKISVAEPLIISGDRAKLRHLLLNILDNAMKYTPAQGTVTVKAGRSQQWARVEISDTGSGIPAAELPRIFERFYRGKTSLPTGGFGLGLSIARSVAEAHRGRIEVVSELCKGTTCTVWLPLAGD